MALSNFQSFKDFDDNKIQETIVESKKELFNLRLQKATRQSFKAHNFKYLKRQIAQLMTLQSQRELNNN